MRPSPANCRRRPVAAGSGGALAAAAAVVLSFVFATAVHPTEHSSVATIPRVAAFVPSARRGRSRIIAAYTSSDGGDDKSEEPADDDGNEEDDDDGLAWRLAKVKLEEANTRRFLKSQPLKLSYADSQQWIQRNWAPKTQAEFEDLVANGNLRTPYISKRPEEYYGRRGEWISWEHYLLGEEGCRGLNDTEAEWE